MSEDAKVYSVPVLAQELDKLLHMRGFQLQAKPREILGKIHEAGIACIKEIVTLEEQRDRAELQTRIIHGEFLKAKEEKRELMRILDAHPEECAAAIRMEQYRSDRRVSCEVVILEIGQQLEGKKGVPCND